MSASAWPVSYRSTAPEPWRRGFQQPERLPTPANDNRWAANDNFVESAKKFRRIAARVPFGRNSRGFARAFTIIRRHPLWKALDAIDAMELLLRKPGQLVVQSSAYGGSDWYQYSQCPTAGPPTHVSFGGMAAPPIYCISGQAYNPSVWVPFGTPIPRYYYGFIVGHHKGDAFTHPMEVVSVYGRDVLPRQGAPDEPALVWQPPATWVFPDVAPALEPTVNPMAVPIARPGPEKAPVPYRLIPYRQPNPFLSPHEQSNWGPRTLVREAGELSWKFDPRYRNRVRPEAKPHVRQPPGKGTKERKLNLSIGGVPGKIIGGVTEAVDAVDAIYAALPSKYKSPGLTPQEKAAQIYRHFDQVDLRKALANLFVQQVSDRAWGTIGKAAAQAAVKGGLPRGLQFGPWDTAGGYYGTAAEWAFGGS